MAQSVEQVNPRAARWLVPFVALLLHAGLVGNVRAFSEIDEELDRLPTLCKFKTKHYRMVRSREGSMSPEVRRANQWGYHHYGDAWSHMHHYCRGLAQGLRAAEALGTPAETAALRSVISNHMYVIDNTSPPFTEEYLKLRTELYYQIGRAYERLEQYEQAAVSYSTAIQRDPADDKAYAALSDLFRKLGQTDEAREIVLQGLERAPDSARLQRREAELAN
jgi:tetratricopeptide (TPR) repeat protein